MRLWRNVNTWYGIRRWYRRLQISIFIAWADATKLGVPILQFSITLLLLYFLLEWRNRGLAPIFDFYRLVSSDHAIRTARSLISFVAVWVLIFPGAAFIWHVFHNESLHIGALAKRTSRIGRYVGWIIIAWITFFLALPFFALRGFGPLFGSALPRAIELVVVFVVTGSGLVAVARRRVFKLIQEIDVGTIAEFCPHEDVIHLATGYLSPRIEYIDRRMNQWKRVEDFLGTPSRTLYDFLISGKLELKHWSGPVTHFFHSGPWKGINTLRRNIAEAVGLSGVKPESNVGICGSATTSFDFVFQGLRDVVEGEVAIVRTDQEYDTVVDKLKSRFNGATEHIVQLYDERLQWRGESIVSEIVDVCRSELEVGRSCIVVVSHVLNETGAIFPIKALHEALFAQTTQHDHRIILVVDGAHSIGHIPVRLQEIPRAIFVWSGHKWLFGPHGTGGLIFGPYVPNTITQCIRECVTEPFAFDDGHIPTITDDEKSQRQAAGIDTSRFIGLAASFTLHSVVWREKSISDQIALKATLAKQKRQVLVRALLDQFQGHADVLFHNEEVGFEEHPSKHILAPGIVILRSTRKSGKSLEDFHNTVTRDLAEEKIFMSVLSHTRNIRLCVTSFLTPDKIEICSKRISARMMGIGDSLS